ncbi:MAG: hypothetical protein AAFY38_16375 [Pseudomonadota bacterium]
MTGLRAFCVVFFTLLPQGLLACAVLPGLGPLISYAQAVEMGAPVARGDTLTAARVLAQEDTGTLPQRMRYAGHAEQTGALLTFLGAFEGLIARAMAGDMASARSYARSSDFGRAFAGAQQAHKAVCDGGDGASRAKDISAGMPARVGGDGHGAGARRGLSPYETPLATSAQRVVVAFLGLLSSVIVLHYALLWWQTAQRRRRLVSIPAVLRAGAGGIAGRVTVIEVQGAKFVAGDALRGGLSAGMPLTLSIAGVEVAGQVLSSGKIAQHVAFDDALDTEAYAKLLAASLTPPRRDPMARDRAFGADNGYRYGQAHVLSTAKRTQIGETPKRAQIGETERRAPNEPQARRVQLGTKQTRAELDANLRQPQGG